MVIPSLLTSINCVAIAFMLSLVAIPTHAGEVQLSDDQIKQMMIHESISSYSGNCPCPYNYARNGSHCGRRSAYSRAGGSSPFCYPADISKEMIEAYRQHGGAR